MVFKVIFVHIKIEFLFKYIKNKMAEVFFCWKKEKIKIKSKFRKKMDVYVKNYK